MKLLQIVTACGSAIAAVGCVLVVGGCQTCITWEKNPEVAKPIHAVVETNGVREIITTGYQMEGGGWYVKARSPLWAKEQFSGFALNLGKNGEVTVKLDTYDRDLSTNAIVMTKTIFDGSANLALAVAKAYATISTGGATDESGAIVSKVMSFFKSKGGDASKSTVTSDGTVIKVTDGSTCISCDAAGNCSSCSPE